MNKVILVGRLTKDPEVRNTSSQVPFCNFTVAVDRRFKDQNGQRQADFINCVAWRQTATFISTYFRKGARIGIVGSLQSRSYDDQNGQKRYVTEVVVEEAEFVESSNSGNREQSAPQAQSYGSTVATSAPAAPKTQIAPDMDSDSLNPGGDIELPFDF